MFPRHTSNEGTSTAANGRVWVVVGGPKNEDASVLAKRSVKYNARNETLYYKMPPC